MCSIIALVGIISYLYTSTTNSNVHGVKSNILVGLLNSLCVSVRWSLLCWSGFIDTGRDFYFRNCVLHYYAFMQHPWNINGVCNSTGILVVLDFIMQFLSFDDKFLLVVQITVCVKYFQLIYIFFSFERCYKVCLNFKYWCKRNVNYGRMK